MLFCACIWFTSQGQAPRFLPAGCSCGCLHYAPLVVLFHFSMPVFQAAVCCVVAQVAVEHYHCCVVVQVIVGDIYITPKLMTHCLRINIFQLLQSHNHNYKYKVKIYIFIGNKYR